MVRGWGCGLAAKRGSGARLRTQWLASYGHLWCRENATCVPGPERSEPPDGKRGRSSVPGYGGSRQETCGSPADRIGEGEKDSPA
jgi:hypothetical protein